MKIAIVNDHWGYDLKKYIIKHMKDVEFVDLGSDSKEISDWSEYGLKLGEYIVKNKCFGVSICRTGVGMAIACNKVKGVRCAKVNSIKETILSRSDDDVNAIAIPGEIKPERAVRIIEEFINTEFSQKDRYIRRKKQISEYENK
ncbi:MAG: RpiB/LacA/LacB family sugar-phosphate isomerase [Bacilli bacterium]|nr:RpiB/LacA/LacB family sugar-phosphate isomerase [Bacilli bacterium]